MKKIVSMFLSVVLALTGVVALAEEGWAPGPRAFNAGEITLERIAAGGGEIDTEVWAGEAGRDYTDEKVYTYNNYMVAMGGGLDWNPHTWETNEDSFIMLYNTSGFYEFVVNADGDGYSIMPEMAADYASDVTAEYAGTYGVAEGETNKVFRIPLNPNATWENGEKITADDYIYSMQQQLNPKMLNRRADSYYQGEFNVLNVQNYLYAGQMTYNAFTSLEDAGENGVFVDMWGFWGLEGCVDAEGNECPQYVAITDETLWRDVAVEDETAEGAWISAKQIYDDYFAPGAAYEAEAVNYLKVGQMAADVTWDDVGLKKIDDYTIDIILSAPLSGPAFYLPYYLSGTWLVYKPLYEACKSFYDAEGNAVETEEEATTVTTTYCTTLDTTMGYGPYKLTYYELDKQITLSRNENWHGYADGRHSGQFQMDVLDTTIIGEQATALLAFLAGELDGVSLVAGDMEKYAASEYIMYTPESYTTKISFNTDYEKLVGHGTNSQIMVIDEFRQGFAYALDRNHFATSFTAAGTGGFGLLNNMYVYDPFTGALYRDSESAKHALVSLNGLTYGEGGDYATVDEAYDAMTGYDMAAAQELMKAAYDRAVAEGVYDGTSPIEIEFRVYQNDTMYIQMYTYFESQMAEAIKGSGFEGKLTMKMTVDPDYYETMYSGGADIIFTTWGGAQFDPFGTMARIYCDASDGSGNQMEVGFDTTLIDLTFVVDGEEMTFPLQTWAKWANYDPVPEIEEKIGGYAELSYANRCAFYAGMEHCFLSYYTAIPMYYRNVASLRSQKVSYAVDTYLQLVQFGNVTQRFTTFNYDDAAWAEYIAANPLEY